MNSTTYIYDTALQGDLARVQELVKSGSDVNGIRVWPNRHLAPLSAAASKGHLTVVQFLVECNANMELSDRYGRTPLNLAARNGSLTVVQYLVEHGANMESSDKYGQTPLNSAVDMDHVNVVQYLIDCGANVNSSDNDD